MTKTPEFDDGMRGTNYRKAVERFPQARNYEMLHLMLHANPQPGEHILDFGTGDGYISCTLAEKVAPKGKVYAIDNSTSNLEYAAEKAERNGIQNIELVQFTEGTATIPLPDGCIDTIVSLATLHHCDEKKPAIFREFSRLLRHGGKIVIGDIAHATPVQRYMDEFIHAHCSTGHDHRFLDEKEGKELCAKSGLISKEWKIEYVPWVFPDAASMPQYAIQLHDLRCTPEQWQSAAKKYLGLTSVNGNVALNWQLFYLVAEKK